MVEVIISAGSDRTFQHDARSEREKLLGMTVISFITVFFLTK